jgi:hypothetical protein
MDCNRFVDYIVAESLAQRHPQLKSQVAAAHSHFRSRIKIRNADGRPPPGGRTVRSILSKPTSDSVEFTDIQPGYPANDPTTGVDGEVEDSPDGYQLNALRGSFPESSDDFDLCFQAVDFQSCTTPDATTPFFESVCGDDVPFDVISDIPSVDSDSFLSRRLSETYDPNSRAIYAHADNGSMACTTSDSSLLFSYRALAGSNTKVRLFDAGSHSHHPDGVGFLCLPAFRVPPLALVASSSAHTILRPSPALSSVTAPLPNNSQVMATACTALRIALAWFDSQAARPLTPRRISASVCSLPVFAAA